MSGVGRFAHMHYVPVSSRAFSVTIMHHAVLFREYMHWYNVHASTVQRSSSNEVHIVKKYLVRNERMLDTSGAHCVQWFGLLPISPV